MSIDKSNDIGNINDVEEELSDNEMTSKINELAAKFGLLGEALDDDFGGKSMWFLY